MVLSDVDRQGAVLRYGEMAIALYAARSLPHPERHRPSLKELDGYAVQGVSWLGGAGAVRTLHGDLLTAGRALLDRWIDEAAYQARVSAVLRRAGGEPDLDRLSRCLGYAYARARVS